MSADTFIKCPCCGAFESVGVYGVPYPEALEDGSLIVVPEKYFYGECRECHKRFGDWSWHKTDKQI